MAVTHPTAVRNALCNLVVDLIDADSGAGYLEFQTSGDVEVATCAFSATAFDAAGSAGGNSDGVATADTISDDTNAAGGTIAKARAFDGADTEVFACSVTTSGGGGDIIITSTAITATETVGVTALTYEAPD
jgi:hypothetical protein